MCYVICHYITGLIIFGIDRVRISGSPVHCLCILCAHGSFLIRRQRGHPGVVLPLVISNSANLREGVQLELGPIRNEPNSIRTEPNGK